jgi:hypothetical protein
LIELSASREEFAASTNQHVQEFLTASGVRIEGAPPR